MDFKLKNAKFNLNFFLFILIIIFSINFISATEYIDSCMVLNESGETYYLSENLNNVSENCMTISAPNITFDCQGHFLKNDNLQSTIIYTNQDYTTIKNCNLSAKKQGTTPSMPIYIKSNYNVINGNNIENCDYGIVIKGHNNLLEKNFVRGCIRGIQMDYSNNNIIKDNYLGMNRQSNGVGFGVLIQNGEGNQFFNNKIFGSGYGVYLQYTKNTVFKCDIFGGYRCNAWGDIKAETNYNSGVKAYGITSLGYYCPLDVEGVSLYEGSCRAVDCVWGTGNKDEICTPANYACRDDDRDGYFNFERYACYKGDDCDDSDSAVNPGAEDILGNMIDESCGNGLIIDKLTDCYSDIKEDNTYYYLDDDIEVMGGYCYEIEADNIIIDCRGHTIDFNGDMLFTAHNVKNVTIRNCNIRADDKWFNPHVIDLKNYPSYTSNNPDVPEMLIENNKISGAINAITVEGGVVYIKDNILTDNIYAVDAKVYMLYFDKNNLINNSRGLYLNNIDAPGYYLYNRRNIINYISIIKNNLIKGNEWAGIRFEGKNTKFTNNKVYNNNVGNNIMPGINMTLECDQYTDNRLVDIWVRDVRSNVLSISSLYGSKTIEAGNFEEIENLCNNLECVWSDDECLDDLDRDKIPDINDACLNTPSDETSNSDGCSCSQITVPFRTCPEPACEGENLITYSEGGYDYCENGILTKYSCEAISTEYNSGCDADDDNDTVIDEEDFCPNTNLNENQIVYGCSCNQILAIKPGEDKGELKNGCSKGTIDVFTKKQGWAKNL